MTNSRHRDSLYSSLKLAALLSAFLALLGCTGAPGQKSPGLAGVQTPDPVTLDYPLAYVKRPVPVGDIDVRDLITATPGGDLFVRSKASASGVEVNVTKDITTGMGDVRDLDVSQDGTKVLFSLRLPLLKNVTAAKQPTWNIWEYDAKAQSLRRIIGDDVTAEQGHDVGAHYLPDGRIVFASTRQDASRAILLNEGRPQYQGQTDTPSQAAFELHVMNPDGSGIHQISFNTDHDFAPSVLANSQIVFSRWENVNGSARINLYRANPDGTGLELYYGQYSHGTGTNESAIQFLNARVRPDGQLITLVRPFLGTQLGGDLALINGEGFVDINQTSAGTAGGPGQSPATALTISTVPNTASTGGRFAAAYPLFDGTDRMLVSWSPCLVLDATQTPAASVLCTPSNSTGTNIKLAPPEYTLWVYDAGSGTLQPLLSAVPGMMIVDPVILQSRPQLQPIPDKVPGVDVDQSLFDGGVGVLEIKSVYDLDGVDSAQPNIAALADPKQTTADQRIYRFIRIEKPVEQPDPNVRLVPAFAFGPAGLGMKDILAYAPIEPDGSVRIQVPANVPFALELLDKNGRRVGVRHASWMQVVPGEVRSCNGCHDSAKSIAHGRTGLSVSVNPGAPANNQPFPNTLPTLPAIFKEVMAETRTRITCPTEVTIGCSAIPSANLIYTDVWTNPAVRAPDVGFSYLYSDLSTLAPINSNCLPAWSGQCRITIHYPDAPISWHIQPVWNLPRQTLAADGVTILSDHTCVLCHSTKDAAGNAQQPAAQLDLTNSTSTLAGETHYLTSYADLLFPHDEQALMMGALQNVMVTGQTALVTTPGIVTAGSANASTSFFNEFVAGGTHSGYLTPAELRLISEWLDIGAQYYNDPFVAPAN